MTERVPLLRKAKQPNGQASELSIEQALRDSNLLGAALGNPKSWSTWLTVLKAAFGQQLTEQELTVFEQVAGERPVPTSRVRELWAIVGRRGGKSRTAAAVAVYIACFCKDRHPSQLERRVTSWFLQPRGIKPKSSSGTVRHSFNKVRSCGRRSLRLPPPKFVYEEISASGFTLRRSATYVGGRY